MLFSRLPIDGACLIESEKIADDRGFFMRTFCQREMEDHGLPGVFVQSNLSVNRLKGTLRGLHFQERPHEEAKIIRCGKGSLFLVIADVRGGSATFGKWHAVTLTPREAAVFVPPGCANGYLTLEDDTEVHYQMSDFYHPESARGIRWDDEALAIAWPMPRPIVISPRDAALPDLAAVVGAR